MRLNHPAELANPSIPAAGAPEYLRTTAIVLAASAFVAVCAHVALPLAFTPVPLTLQPFAVLLVGLLLTPRTAGAALIAYLAEGAAGLPVFAPGLSGSLGLAHLLGPTGGYLLVYPAAAFLISWLYGRGSRTFAWALAAAAAGNLLILAAGALWLGLFIHASAATILTQSVVPFLPGDALKIAAAAAIAVAFGRFRSLRSSTHPTA